MIKIMEKCRVVLPHAFHGSHVIYFAAAAFGAHDVYAAVAGVIVLLFIAGHFLHVEL